MRLRILLTVLALAPLGVCAHEGHDHEQAPAVAAPAKPAAPAPHVHGPDCDHSHDHAPAAKPAAPAPHVHGPDCDHDHDHAHAPATPTAAKPAPHVHGPDCDHDHDHAGHAHAHADEGYPRVALSPVQRQNLGVRAAAIVPGKITREAFALGELIDDPRGESAASVRVAGRVVELRVALGDRVKKGDTLALVESRQAGGDPARVPVVALADGVVHEMLTRLGEPVSPDAPLMRLADHTRLLAEARIPQIHAASLVPGKTRARVTLAGGADKELVLAGFAPQDDAPSGTRLARFVVDNADLALAPGRRAEFRVVLDEKQHALTVPRDAVQGERGDLFVFVENEPGIYEKHPVVVVDSDSRIAAITGPAAGERVVVHGSGSLRYAGTGDMTMQEALATAHGPDCGHDHSQGAHAPTHAPAATSKPAAPTTGKTAIQAELDTAHGHAHAADGSELPAAPQAGESFFNSHAGVIFFAVIALGEAPLLFFALRSLRRSKKESPDA